MTWTRDEATRIVVLLATAVVAVLGTSLPASPSVGAAVVTAALAALMVLSMQQVYVALQVRPAFAFATAGPAPVLAGRVTDPVHPPLRPRAPGPA